MADVLSLQSSTVVALQLCKLLIEVEHCHGVGPRSWTGVFGVSLEMLDEGLRAASHNSCGFAAVEPRSNLGSSSLSRAVLFNLL